ncbi:hypothetical protein GCM10023219_19630 [Stakelama sediminis]
MLGTTIIYDGAEIARHLVNKPHWHVVQSCTCSVGVHHVLTGRKGRYRLWQPGVAQMNPPAFLIPDDKFTPLRSEALNRLQLALGGRSPPKPSPHFSPSTYQCRRLANMLAMLDAREAGATIRELAFTLVYPNSRLLRGAEWKASGEKRHVLRLLRSALKLRGGYRTFPGFDCSI